MVGSALTKKLIASGYKNLITATHKELDLCDQQAVRHFLQKKQPDYTVVAAAKVGGIYANNAYPADFIYQNLMIEANLIHESYQAGVENLLFLGSSCIYPKYATQPITEQELLTGNLESTNEPYAVAKIAGIKLCESYNRQYKTDYRSIMPTNLYGEKDNFHPENSHVIPALIRRFHEAKINQQPCVTVWGTGQARREFLYIDDMATACLHVMNLNQKRYQKQTQVMLSHINIGTGFDVTIKALAEMIAEVVNYQGEIIWNTQMPDGTPKKLLDVSRVRKLGWSAKISLKEGLQKTYRWFLQHEENYRTK